MIRIKNEHPLDEELMEFALQSDDATINEHIKTCPSCSRYVKEIQTLKTVLQSLPDENVPAQIRNAILKNMKSKNKLFIDWHKFDITTWYKNPLFLGIGIICVLLFLYMFLTFVI